MGPNRRHSAGSGKGEPAHADAALSFETRRDERMTTPGTGGDVAATRRATIRSRFCTALNRVDLVPKVACGGS
jgi:hypothetical protein